MPFERTETSEVLYTHDCVAPLMLMTYGRYKFYQAIFTSDIIRKIQLSISSRGWA